MRAARFAALRRQLAAVLITVLTVLGTGLATLHPTPARANTLQDTLGLLSQFAPLVDTYIAPASLTWLPPLYEALASPACGDLGSDIAVVQCADALLAQPAAAHLAGASVHSLRTVLELYLDVRSSDWGELFNDVFKLVTGGDPLTVVCKVLAIVTSGFPVCGVLELLYDIGRYAYEAAGQVLEGFKTLGCALISFAYDCDDGGTQVSAVQFVADVYFKPRLSEGVQARLAGAAAWAQHRQQLLAARNASQGEPQHTNNPALNDEAFAFYAKNYVGPAWAAALDKVRSAAFAAATQFVQADPDLYLKLLNAPDDTARRALAAERRDLCAAVTQPFVQQLQAAAAEGQGSADNLNGPCTSALRDAVIRPSVFQRGVGNSGSSNDWLSTSFATMAVCEALRVALLQPNPLHNPISGCGVRNPRMAGQLAMATLQPLPAGCTAYNVEADASRIVCTRAEAATACNGQLQARYGGVGLPNQSLAYCGVQLATATGGFGGGAPVSGSLPTGVGVGGAALHPGVGAAAAEPPRCTATPRTGVLQCPTAASYDVCLQLKRRGRVLDCLPPR